MNSPFRNFFTALWATILYSIAIELLGLWTIIPYSMNSTGDPFLNNYQFIQGFLQLLGIMIFVFWEQKAGYKNLFPKIDFKWYLAACLIGIAFVFIQMPLNFSYNFLFGTDFQIQYKYLPNPELLSFKYASYILFIPISEELFFRSYIQKSLEKNVSVRQSIIWSSLLFALIHAIVPIFELETSPYGWHQTFIALFGGSISAVMYYKSKSMGPSILFHVFWNLWVYGFTG